MTSQIFHILNVFQDITLFSREIKNVLVFVQVIRMSVGVEHVCVRERVCVYDSPAHDKWPLAASILLI